MKKLIVLIKKALKLIAGSFMEEMQDFDQQVRRDGNYYK